MSTGARQWIVDALLGGIAGGVVGAIVAVNFVIYSSIPDIFDENVVIGVVTVAILVGGPIAGIAVARQRRRRRERGTPV